MDNEKESSPLLRNTSSFFQNVIEKEEEVIFLSPLEKFKKYKRIPCELILDVLLIIGIFFVIFLTTTKNDYIQNIGESLSKRLLPPEFEHFKHHNFAHSTYYHYDIQEILDDITNTVKVFTEIVQDSPDTLGYVNYKNRTDSVRLKIEYFETNLRDFLSDPATWNISKPSLKAFYFLPKKGQVRERIREGYGVFLNRTGEALRDIFDRLYTIEMKMSLHSYFLSRNSRVPDCLEWEIIKTYDFSSNAGAPTRLDYNYFYCDNYNPFPYNKLSFWVEVITLVLSVVAFFVNSFLLFERILFYCKKKKQNPNLTLDIRKYMVHWFFIAILGNVLNVVGILFLLVKINEDTITYGHSFLGFGAFFTCVAVIRNYYHYPKFYFLVNVLEVALPGCLRLFVATIPLFFGYAMAGTIWFGHFSTKFEKVIDSFVTLFCVMHGDVIRQIFNSTFGYDTYYKTLSRVYLYSFLFIFIAICLNIFLMILEESYLQVGTLTLSQHQKSYYNNNENEEEIVVGNTENKNLQEVNQKLKEIIKKIKDQQAKKLTREQEKCISLIQFYTDQLLDNK